MRVVVCVKQSAGGDINPFDACAYEEALRNRFLKNLLTF